MGVASFLAALQPDERDELRRFLSSELEAVAQALAATRPAHSKRASLVDVDELADVLGVTRRSVYELTANHELPAYRLGRALRFDVDAVLAWLENRRTGDWSGTL
jgi:excisionase family DNA binding protein